MLEINIFVLIAQAINFAVMYYIFKRFIASKLLERLEERKVQLQKLETAEKHYEEKMALAEKERDDMIAEARKTSRNLMQESETLAFAKADAIKSKAKAEALAILEGGKQELEKERISMLARVKNHIMDVSLKLNEKMFVSEKLSKEFLEKEIRSL